MLQIFVLICVLNSIPRIDAIYGYDYGPVSHTVEHPKKHEISVIFPKYNIKIAPSSMKNEPEVIYQQIEEDPDPQVIYQEVDADSDPQVIYQHIKDLPMHNEPQVIYQEVEPYNMEEYEVSEIEPDDITNDNLYHFQQYYAPVITREPISLAKPCIQKYRSHENVDPDLGAARSQKHKTDSWFFSAPNWNMNNNNNMNILRAADPRSLISSHTHFVKIKKPVFGSKVFISHNKKIISDGHDHHYGFGGHFGDIGGHYNQHGGHFGTTNINKNTHVHVHNRNAEPVAPVLHQRHSSKSDESIIGSHLFAAPRWRRNIRNKRGFMDIPRLMVDPKSKIDVKQTSANLGSATRNIFTDEISPVYHFTNAVGAARDSIYSLMNVRPSGILFPCSYRIVHANDLQNVQQSSPIVGGINPEIYSLHNQSPPASFNTESADNNDSPPNYPLGPSADSYSPQYPDYNYNNGDPLHIIGDKLRESVQWAHKSANHASDTLHHVRRMLSSARKDLPKLLLPYAGALEITRPKLGNQDEPIVGSVKDPEFVGIGRMMDSLGMTDRKPDISPRVGGPRMISEEEMILKKAKEVLGVPTYRSFLDAMKKHLDVGNIENVGRPRLKPSTDLQTKIALDKLRSALLVQKAKADFRRFQAGKIKPPKPIIRNPLLRSPEPSNLKQVKPLNPQSSPLNSAALDKLQAHLENIKPANIVPITTTPKPPNPLEKLRQKLSKKYNIPNDSKNSDMLGKTLAAVKNSENVGAPKGPQNGEVPVPMLTKEMKTPFMGLATKNDLEQYFKKLYCSQCKMGDIKK